MELRLQNFGRGIWKNSHIATLLRILWLTQERLLHAISFNRVEHKCCRICANHPESGWLAENFWKNHAVEIAHEELLS